MTPAEKGRETRRANRAAQERREAEKREAMAQDLPLIIGALRAVLAAPEAEARERLIAAILLDDVQGYNLLNGYRVRDMIDKIQGVDFTADFVKELEAFEAKRNGTT